jgi:hypothetical protein
MTERNRAEQDDSSNSKQDGVSELEFELETDDLEGSIKMITDLAREMGLPTWSIQRIDADGNSVGDEDVHVNTSLMGKNNPTAGPLN